MGFVGGVKKDKDGNVVEIYFPDVGWIKAKIAPVKVWGKKVTAPKEKGLNK
jgi:hypothetical protein